MLWEVVRTCVHPVHLCMVSHTRGFQCADQGRCVHCWVDKFFVQVLLLLLLPSTWPPSDAWADTKSLYSLFHGRHTSAVPSKVARCISYSWCDETRRGLTPVSIFGWHNLSVQCRFFPKQIFQAYLYTLLQITAAGHSWLPDFGLSDNCCGCFVVLDHSGHLACPLFKWAFCSLGNKVTQFCSSVQFCSVNFM